MIMHSLRQKVITSRAPTGNCLQLLHSDNVGGLDVVLELFDLLLELVQRDLVVLDDQVDLELLDTETDSDQLGGTPDETVLLDGENVGLELVHVCLVVYGRLVSQLEKQNAVKHTPGLDVHGDDRLGSRLYLAGLLLVVLGKTLSLDLLGLGILLLVAAAEKVDLVVVLSLLLGSLGGVDSEVAGLRAVGGEVLGGVTRQGLELTLEGEEVVVPAPCVGELLGGGDLLDLLEDLDIGLGGRVADLC